MKHEDFDDLGLDLGSGKETQGEQVPQSAPAEPNAWQQPYGAPADPNAWQQPYGAPAEPNAWQQPYGTPADPNAWQQPYGAPADPNAWQQPYGAPTDPNAWQQPYGAPADPYAGQPYPPYGGYPQPPKPKKKPPYILISVIAAVILIAVILLVSGVFKGKGDDAAMDGDAAAAPGVGTSETAAPEATPAPTPNTEAEEKNELPETPAPTAPLNQQIVEVTSNGSTGTLVLKEWRDGEWVELMATTAHLGRNGISENKVDGDGCTPAGTFDILFYMSLGEYDSGLEYVPVVPGDIWVVDSDSASYNTLRNTANSGDWNSQEVEYIYNMFANGMTSARIMFSYNGDGRNAGTADSGGGSAIFIDGTASSGELTRGYGDILITDMDIASLLYFLDSAKNPILIVQ